MDHRAISAPYPKVVSLWLGIGLIMIFLQVVIGGITRLTGSGLSITEWEIVTGTLPPLDAASWEKAFEAYRATPQYQKINQGMTMQEFRFIYFWEYVHRLWARTMGVVFAIPFFIFLRKGFLDWFMIRRLLVVMGLAAIVASFGWIMVASGLTDRPWVNAYKLTLHLSLALILFGYLLWTFFYSLPAFPRFGQIPGLRRYTILLLILLGVQIVLGGIVSGSKAGPFYPTWPDMNGHWIPEVLFQHDAFLAENFINYDSNPYFSAWIQAFHRGLAYLLSIAIIAFLWRYWRESHGSVLRSILLILGIALAAQLILGIFTVTHSVPSVPVGSGVAHQAMALVLLFLLLTLAFGSRKTMVSN